MTPFGRNLTIVTFLFIVFTILGIKCMTTIHPGYAGLVYNMNGGLENQLLGQGWHIVAPWKKVMEYPIATETVFLTKDSREGSENDDSFMINTRDGKPVNVDVTYAYHFDPDKLTTIYTRFKGRDVEYISNGYVKQVLKEACNDVASQFGILDIYGSKRADLNAMVFEKFRDALKPSGIVIESFNFSRIEPDKATLIEIQKVVDAQNALKRAQFEKDRAEIDAQKRRIVAQGEAEAKKAEADGISYYNKKVQESASKEVISLRWIEKWDGKLPVYQLGNGSNTLIQLPTSN